MAAFLSERRGKGGQIPSLPSLNSNKTEMGLSELRKREELGPEGTRPLCCKGCRAYERKAQSLSKTGPKYAKVGCNSKGPSGEPLLHRKNQADSEEDPKEEAPGAIFMQIEDLMRVLYFLVDFQGKDFWVEWGPIFVAQQSWFCSLRLKSESPSSSIPSFCGLTSSFPSSSVPTLPSSTFQSQFLMENQVIQLAYPYQMTESVNPFLPKPISPNKASNLVTVSQGVIAGYSSGVFQIEGLSPRKMAKTREVLKSLDIKNTRGFGSRKKRRVVKDFLRSEKPDVVMIQETKKAECDRRFMGCVGQLEIRNGQPFQRAGLRLMAQIAQYIEEGFLGGAFRHFWTFFPVLVCGRRFQCHKEKFRKNESLQEVLPRWTSDHWPIVLETNPFKWGPTPFRFENMWLQHPSFKEHFGSWWREFQGNGWEGHKFMRQLQFVKAKLKAWNKASFGEINERKKSILLDLANFDTMEQERGLDWSPIFGESASRLESPFTEEEISKAIFQLDRDKAPGPNGFTIAMFQDCWDVIKEDLVRVFAEFHRSGIINQSTNVSFIIIAKVLAGCLRGVLHETIHSTQGAFVQGRQILDAVLIANEIVDEKRLSGNEGVVFKIDFEKAYDRVINGNAKGWVKASRGLRQGDPLSPFLFTLVADVLSRMLLRAEERNALEGFRVGRNRTRVSHLQFADDTSFFSSTREEDMLTLKSVLLVFGHISMLKVNLDKSNIYGINLEQNHLSRLAELLDCKASGWPILYLGLPLGGNPKACGF
ncbi:putative mitochondrial protein [Vitis vinifera]|uniref:Putative mitochondrial protein n=1 Tax=Vitis vinifera TaxID=29760 RepID=A0A438HA62_VITVI|nr:putative mitochondrial protein [Vitis vinifera]